MALWFPVNSPHRLNSIHSIPVVPFSLPAGSGSLLVAQDSLSLLFSDLIRAESPVGGSIYPDGSSAISSLDPGRLPSDRVLPGNSAQVLSAPQGPQPPWGLPPTPGLMLQNQSSVPLLPSPRKHPLLRFSLLIFPLPGRGSPCLISEVSPCSHSPYSSRTYGPPGPESLVFLKTLASKTQKPGNVSSPLLFALSGHLPVLRQQQPQNRPGASVEESLKREGANQVEKNDQLKLSATSPSLTHMKAHVSFRANRAAKFKV